MSKIRAGGVFEDDVDLAVTQSERQRARQLANCCRAIGKRGVRLEKKIGVATLRSSSALDPNTLTRAPSPSTRCAVWRMA